MNVLPPCEMSAKSDSCIMTTMSPRCAELHLRTSEESEQQSYKLSTVSRTHISITLGACRPKFRRLCKMDSRVVSYSVALENDMRKRLPCVITDPKQSIPLIGAPVLCRDQIHDSYH